MSSVTGLKCLVCGAEYSPREAQYVCPLHGDDGVMDVQYDYAAIARTVRREDLAQNRDYSMWRYRPLLPVEADSPAPPLRVGWTPLYRAERLAESMNLSGLFIKDDTRQPTASLKDRASAVAVVKAREEGARVVATASTGNAAAALAGLSASVGWPSVIFVPASAPEAKIAQLLVFGSTVLMVEGTYDDAFDLCIEAARSFGWYNRNTGYNPYMTEGKKTVGFEICEQLDWVAPDCIFAPVGDGCIIGGLHKGLKDLLDLEWIQRKPRLMGVQAVGSAALYNAWKAGIDPLNMKPMEVHTFADSIAVSLPRDRIKAMRAVRETGGVFLTVTDDEILQAVGALARGCGVFAEPAGAASFAGLTKAVQMGLVEPDERIVVLVTGSGLKDVGAAMRVPGAIRRIRPDLEAVREALSEIMETP